MRRGKLFFCMHVRGMLQGIWGLGRDDVGDIICGGSDLRQRGNSWTSIRRGSGRRRRGGPGRFGDIGLRCRAEISPVLEHAIIDSRTHNGAVSNQMQRGSGLCGLAERIAAGKRTGQIEGG